MLQEKTFRRLGGASSHSFRARLLVSSRRDLSALVEDGLFRPDLFYRIDVISIRLPRLIDRSEDILPLARRFLKKAARTFRRPARKFTRDAEQALLRHSWPGNIRELLHVVERAALACGTPAVAAEDLPAGAFGSARAIRWMSQTLSNLRPDAGGQAPGRLPQSALGTRAEKGRDLRRKSFRKGA